MKTKSLLLFLVCTSTSSFASITDPVADYKNANSLTASDILYKWVADINGDGKNEVFLTLKNSASDLQENFQGPVWRVYLATQTVGQFTLSSGVSNDQALSPAWPQIDTENVFIGQITQLGKHGLVTVQYITPKVGPQTAKVFAYTMEGDHLKQTLLSEFNSTSGNAIFDQYLSDAHRTQIQLQEVAP